MPSLISLRRISMRGDFRALYLGSLCLLRVAWLARRNELDDDGDLESRRSRRACKASPLEALADFLDRGRC